MKICKMCQLPKEGQRCKPCRVVYSKELYTIQKDERNFKRRQRYLNPEIQKQRKVINKNWSDRTKRWEQNLLKRREIMQRWRLKNPASVRTGEAKKWAERHNAEGSFSKEEWLSVCERQQWVCAKCHENKKLTVDHIIPLSRNGTNYIDNIQALCLFCNMSKGVKMICYLYPSLYEEKTPSATA